MKNGINSKRCCTCLLSFHFIIIMISIQFSLLRKYIWLTSNCALAAASADLLITMACTSSNNLSCENPLKYLRQIHNMYIYIYNACAYLLNFYDESHLFFYRYVVFSDMNVRFFCNPHPWIQNILEFICAHVSTLFSFF